MVRARKVGAQRGKGAARMLRNPVHKPRPVPGRGTGGRQEGGVWLMVVSGRMMPDRMWKMPIYVQPIAQHIVYRERLLVRDAEGRAYVWTGDDPGRGVEEIEAGTALWLLTRSWMSPLPPRVWLHVDDLPLAPSPSRSRQRS